MNCKKCHKTIPDESLYCNYCGKKQETTKRKKAKRAQGSGTIYCRKGYTNNPYVAFAPATKHGRRVYLGSYKTHALAQTALEKYKSENFTDLYI